MERQISLDTPCHVPSGGCGHRFDVHAADVNYPNILRCFHSAGNGDGCTEKYADRCKNFVYPPEEK